MENNQIRKKLLNLSISELSKNFKSLEDQAKLGVRVTKQYLVDRVIDEGLDEFLKEKKFRKALISTFSINELSQNFGEKKQNQDDNHYIDSIISFKNYSEKHHKLAEFLNIEIKKTNTTKIIPQEILEVDKHLYPFQNRIRRKMVDFLANEKYFKTIVQMPTGSGKTRTTIEALCDYLRLHSIDKKINIIWLAYNKELCEQAADSFSEYWRKYGHENMDIIRMWGSTSKETINPDKSSFTVISFGAMYNLIKTKNTQSHELRTELKRNCHILICDEAHQAIAQTYKDAIEVALKPFETKLIGLSATPGRNSISGIRELTDFFENKIINISDNNGIDIKDPVKCLQKRSYLSKIIHHELKTGVNIDKDYTVYEDIPDEVLKLLAKDKNRTNIIIDKIRELKDNNKKIIVFATNVAHSDLLEDTLKQFKIKSSSITSNTKDYKRENSIKAFKNDELDILINYGVLTTGFDAPKTDAVIIARPTKSLILYSQMIGRGMRGEKMGGTKTCEIYDVLDNISCLPDMSNAYQLYRDFYK